MGAAGASVGARFGFVGVVGGWSGPSPGGGIDDPVVVPGEGGGGAGDCKWKPDIAIVVGLVALGLKQVDR